VRFEKVGIEGKTVPPSATKSIFLGNPIYIYRYRIDRLY
jgi:hypothetical protein